MVGLRVERATIDFGGGTKVEMKGLLGAFELAIELPLSWEGVKTTGKFKVAVDSLLVEIPDILKSPANRSASLTILTGRPTKRSSR